EHDGRRRTATARSVAVQGAPGGDRRRRGRADREPWRVTGDGEHGGAGRGPGGGSPPAERGAGGEEQHRARRGHRGGGGAPRGRPARRAAAASAGAGALGGGGAVSRAHPRPAEVVDEVRPAASPVTAALPAADAPADATIGSAAIPEPAGAPADAATGSAAIP